MARSRDSTATPRSTSCSSKWACRLTSLPRSSVRPNADTIMSYSKSTVLIRNLHDVFGQNDPARRCAAIDEIFTEDCVFYQPKDVHRGRDEIDRIAGAIEATH